MGIPARVLLERDDLARVSYAARPDAPPTVTFARRNENTAVPDIPWETLDGFLGAQPTARPITQPPGELALPPASAWLGVGLGGATGPRVTLQLWRRLTARFTEMEIAILTDFARVAAAIVGRLPRS